MKTKTYGILLFQSIYLIAFYIFAKYNPSRIPQGYTKESIIALIKQLPEYQGDEVKINIINRVYSENFLINSVIDEMYKVKSNLEQIKYMAKQTNQPEQIWVYKIAVQYYLQQYGNKLEKAKK